MCAKRLVRGLGSSLYYFKGERNKKPKPPPVSGSSSAQVKRAGAGFTGPG